MPTTIRHRLAAATATIIAVTAIMVGAYPSPAAAADTYTFADHAIPNPTRGWTARTVATIDTSHLAGLDCEIDVDTANNQSEHDDNYVTLEGGIPTITVTETESEPFTPRQSATRAILGDRLDVVNHFGAGGTSLTGTITILDCQEPPSATTTTLPATSTTTPASTTTTNATTTTTDATTSTTTTPPTTSVPPPTTTTTVEPPSTTIPPVTTPPPGDDEPPTSSTLPFTGWDINEDGPTAAAGAALLVLGWGLRRAIRTWKTEGQHLA